MNLLRNLLARRRAPRPGSDDTALLAALRTPPADHPVNMPLPAPVMAPPEIRVLAEAYWQTAQPTFTARPAAETGPILAVLSGRHATDARPAPRPVPNAVPAPAPALSREARFAADMAGPRRGGLPLFRKTVRKTGWCGLHAEHPATVPAMRSTGHQEWDRSLALIAEQYEAAWAEIGYGLAEWRLRERRVRAAADAAAALGYPGGAE
jgi:hypothetical protein